MYLSNSQIKERIKEQGLVENLDERHIQGAGLDIRIDKLFIIESGAFLGEEKRDLPAIREVKGPIFNLSPGGYYLCLTMEKVNMPGDLVAFMYNRSTLFRSGVSLRTAVIDPGYKGELTVGVKNEGEFEFKLERGARIGQMVFSLVSGKTVGYNGKYQGGKVK